MKLSEDNIRMILDTLVYDGRAVVTVMSAQQGQQQLVQDKDGDIQRLYRATKLVLQDTGFSRIPCGVCPVSYVYKLVLRTGHWMGSMWCIL